MKVLLITLFLCAIFCGSVFGQVTRVFLVDSFTTDSPALFIITNGQQQTVDNFAISTSIIGTERDLELTALTGNNVVLSAGVADGTFNSAAPKGASGVSLLQYDGTDNSINLNPSGLAGQDFTRSGGFAMRVNITADIGTNVFFRVYSGSATDYCQFKQAIPGNSLPALYTLKYSQFTNVGNGCDFSNVGALEIEVDLAENVDITMDTIEVVSNNPTPTRTPTRTPSRSKAPASASNTRTPSRSKAPASASNTRTPSRSRAPASASNTRTPSRSRAPASASNTRTPSRSRAPASASNSRTPSRSRAPASASNTRTPSRSRAPASASNTRTPSRSRVPASASHTRTPTRSRVPASPSHSRTPTRSRVPASPSHTRTPTRSKVPASKSPTPSRTRTPSHIPKSPSRTPSPSNCVCTCPELECYMFKYGEYTFRGNVARDVNEFQIEGQQAINEEEEGFDFLKFF